MGDDPIYPDVTLTDISAKLLDTSIAPMLAIDHLSPVSLPLDPAMRWPLKGVVVTAGLRRYLLSAPVQHKDRCVNVIFLLATGSPVTFLSDEALAALGVAEDQQTMLQVGINGVPYSVKPVPRDARFKGVSLLGADFLGDIDAQISSDRATCTFTLRAGEGAVPASLR